MRRKIQKENESEALGIAGIVLARRNWAWFVTS